MKQLLLLRHGEASFSQGMDLDRQLTQKGKEKLNLMGETLLKNGFSVDLMYCSDTTRTQETAAIIKNYLPITEEVFTRKIYNSDLNTLLEILENTDEAIESCLLVGHNPTISLLLSHISNSNYIGMQPGMLARIELEVPHWRMIGHGTGTLREILE